MQHHSNAGTARLLNIAQEGCVELDAPIVAAVRAFGLFSRVCNYGRTRQLRHHNLYALNETGIERDPKSPQISSMWRSQGEQVSDME
jgi:hypothetical protein